MTSSSFAFGDAEKIEEMRRHVGAVAGSAPDEQLQLLELLGEGEGARGSVCGVSVCICVYVCA
jgi:hypothetical protein